MRLLNRILRTKQPPATPEPKPPKPPRILPETTILGLRPEQIYPTAEYLNPDFFACTRHQLLTKETPIASMGSCFAREVKNYLVGRGFNYIQTAKGRAARQGSASWDRVYNTFCIRQEFERALGSFDPVEKVWHSGGQLLDPYRKQIVWSDLADREAELAEHRRTASAALSAADVFIVTVGVNEIWHNREDGAVFYQVPPADVFDAKRHLFRLATVEENVANLHRVEELLLGANPKCRFIVTVSPVPLRATFRDDCDVVSASFESKATLLVAVKQFIRESKAAYYFPSYEIVLAASPQPFREDARHVRTEVVAEVMRVFEQQFMVG